MMVWVFEEGGKLGRWQEVVGDNTIVDADGVVSGEMMDNGENSVCAIGKGMHVRGKKKTKPFYGKLNV